MRIGILGLGYVGLTSAACLLKEGHLVVGVEPDDAKLASLAQGNCPISEPGIAALLETGKANGRWQAVASVSEADITARCDIVLVCVGTSSATNGTLDLSHVEAATRDVAAALAAGNRSGRLTVVYRSTMPPGSMETLVRPIYARILGGGFEEAVELAVNPEFMRESTAVHDYFNPARIVIGTADGGPSAALATLYRDIDAPRFFTTFAEAEFVKLVDNAWHATKVSFANEIGRFCHGIGVDPARIYEIFVADTKLNISPHYLRPGGPFGGSCLPKDLRALSNLGETIGIDAPLIGSAMASNDAHKRFLFERCARGLPAGASVLLLGLAFKAESDDLRESPKVELARNLIDAGMRVSIFDPHVVAARLIGRNLEEARLRLPSLDQLLVSEEVALSRTYDAVVDTMGWSSRLPVRSENIIDISRLSL